MNLELSPRYYRLKRLLRAILPNPLPPFMARGKLLRLWQRAFTWEFPSSANYYSQNGQDIFVHGSFQERDSLGYFLDIGAHDGISFSNSYFLEKHLKWNGICIEATPTTFELLQENRRCECIHGCAATFDGEVSFSLLEGETNMGNHVPLSSESDNDSKGDQIVVTALDVRRLLEERIKRVDYLSIDIEGGELDLFKHIAGGSYTIDLVSLEENADPLRVDSEMKRLGFRYLAKVGPDRIYRFRR